MFKRIKYLIQENEELKEFLRESKKELFDLKGKCSKLLEENNKMRRTLTDIEKAVAPLVTKTIEISNDRSTVSYIRRDQGESQSLRNS